MAEPDLKRVDFEPYFLMWNSALFYPNPTTPENEILLFGHAGDMGAIPVHQHKSCGAMVKADSKYPPAVCPHCNVDCRLEAKVQGLDEMTPVDFNG